ncbi:hypothetical protein ACOKS3_00940 [Pseudomonas sp. HS6-2]|uniref:hypothetical protein n=1 Tax=Pseudomonas sp. HS6-2 TaxID=3410986 RepID=UPI003BE1C124
MNSTTSLQQIISVLQAAERDLANAQIKSSKDSQAGNDSYHSPNQASNTQLSELKLNNDRLNANIASLESKINITSTEISSLKSENSKLAQDLYEIKKENTNKSTENIALSNENEMLIEKLLQVQDELETYYLDKLALEEALTKSQKLIDSARHTINSLKKSH